MPSCPKCTHEYAEGAVTCPECGERLGPPSPPPVPKEYARLLTLSDPAAGLVLQGALEAAGIPVILQNCGPVSGWLAGVADDITEDYAVLHVPEDRLEEAQRLVEDIQREPPHWPEGMEPED